MNNQRQVILSGIQPSNSLHIGNYLGAVRNWLDFQNQYSCYFMMVDLHAITHPQDPDQLRESSYFGIASYIAAGLDPEQHTLFLQSHVSAHAELAWILTCFSYMGELNRMTQFKDKSQRQGKNIGTGLYCYPNLMASDILLYKPHLIPVGDDQKQHVELTRNLASRFNNRYNKDIFQIPEAFIPKEGARIMDLQNPENKMSKSAENSKGVVFLNDTDKHIAKKIKSAVTDSGQEVRSFEEASAGLKNIISIHASLSKTSCHAVAEAYAGKMYGVLKKDTADLAVSMISPLRERTHDLLKDKKHLDILLQKGSEKAQQKAGQTLKDVYDAIGFVRSGHS